MKLNKKNINQLCIVTWKDAKCEAGATLTAFLKEGFFINKTVGWVMYYDKDKLVIATEKCANTETMDMVMIPRLWVDEIEWIE